MNRFPVINYLSLIFIISIFAFSGCGSSSSTGNEETAAIPSYAVVYDGNGNTGGSVPEDSNLYIQGQSVTVLENSGVLIRSGYTFVGWNTAADGSGTDRSALSTFEIGNTNITLYARWAENPVVTYTVTYDANSGEGEVPVDPNNYLPGATATVLSGADITYAELVFTCWNTAADGSGTDMVPGTTFEIGEENITLYAKWTEEETYVVSYDANTGTGEVPADSNSYIAGATVTSRTKGTLSNDGLVFTSWNTQADGTGIDIPQGTTFTMEEGNMVLYAQWAEPADWDESFDYELGGISGQGGWTAWFEDPEINADIVSSYYRSATTSLMLRPDSDMVRIFRGFTEGVREFRTWIYIPSGHTGSTFLMLLNNYDVAHLNANFSTTIEFQDGDVYSLGGSDFEGSGSSGFSLPIVFDQWVSIVVEIDLDANTQTISYNGEELDATMWQANGNNEVMAIDLYSLGGSEVYFDSMSLSFPH